MLPAVPTISGIDLAPWLRRLHGCVRATARVTRTHQFCIKTHTRASVFSACRQGFGSLPWIAPEAEDGHVPGSNLLFAAQRYHEIDAHSAARVDVTGRERDDRKRDGNTDKSDRTSGPDAKTISVISWVSPALR